VETCCPFLDSLKELRTGGKSFTRLIQTGPSQIDKVVKSAQLSKVVVRETAVA
jgi:hypothetical protein